MSGRVHDMSDNSYGLSEDGVTNESAAQREAESLAALIISNAAPANELRRILYASNSLEYARAVANRAANIVVAQSLSDQTNIIIAGAQASRLSEFIKAARSHMARFEPTEP